MAETINFLTMEVMKLTSTNYFVWKKRMMGLFKYLEVDESIVKDQEMSNGKKNRLALQVLLANLENDDLIMVVGEQSAHKAWQKVDNKYMCRFSWMTFILTKKIAELKIKVSHDVDRLACLFNELSLMTGNALSENIKESLLIQALDIPNAELIRKEYLIRGIGKGFHYVAALVQSMMEIEPDHKQSDVELNLDRQSPDNQWAKEKKIFRCFRCGKIGHIRRFCRVNLNQLNE